MKYIILVPDGVADEPVDELGGKTPLEAARTPHMDFMARQGLSAMVKTIPQGLPPGSDIGNLALLGYNPKLNFSGRAPLEAASMGINLQADEIAIRCNLIQAKDGRMFDYSAGHITSEQARPIIEQLNKKLGSSTVRFYAGKSYRHLLVLKTKDIQGVLNIKTTPPHDILNQKIEDYLPSGGSSGVLLQLMRQAQDVFNLDFPKSTANMIWLWGQGCRPNLPLFKDRHGLTGSVISAVDLVNGIGVLAGLEIIQVPGANGYYDTNYKGKADYAIDSLKKHDFVYVHVEATDEAGHNGDPLAKLRCIEKFDESIVGTVREYTQKNQAVRVLISPDHPTPVGKRTHTSSPVPFVIYGAKIESNGVNAYSEKEAGSKGLRFHSGEEMVQYFFKG